jgi:hypothetical protein
MLSPWSFPCIEHVEANHGTPMQPQARAVLELVDVADVGALLELVDVAGVLAIAGVGSELFGFKT